MTGGYAALARLYDTFTENVDYERRADFLSGELSATAAGQGSVLDAGCGTGRLSRLLADRGFDLIGVDCSPEMLSVARERSPKQLLLCQDLCALDLYGTVRGAICMQDTLNHLADEAELRAAVGRIALFLESGCPFLFDLNTEYKHRALLADNCFVYETGDAMCVWQNELDEESGAVDMAVDVFLRRQDGAYERQSDALREVLFDDDTVRRVLAESGLMLCGTLDGDDYGPLTETSERILYLARKQ